MKLKMHEVKNATVKVEANAEAGRKKVRKREKVLLSS